MDEGLVGFGLPGGHAAEELRAMRMAMSCFAFPEAGRPTLRARRSSASVDSGMSERSSMLSGIGLALLASPLADADDANDFVSIFRLETRNQKLETTDAPRSNQLFVTLMIADPEPQKSARSFQSESAIVQGDPRRPNFLSAGISRFLELLRGLLFRRANCLSARFRISGGRA